MQCECPGCSSCAIEHEANCDQDEDMICDCLCGKEGRINTEYGYLCAECYDFYDKSGYFNADDDNPHSGSEVWQSWDEDGNDDD